LWGRDEVASNRHDQLPFSSGLRLPHMISSPNTSTRQPLPCLTTLTHCDTLLFNTHMTSSGHEAPPMLAINPTNTTHNDLRRGSNRYGDPTYTRTLYTSISMLCMCLLSAMAGAHQHTPFSL
jgi:hypothetical protein